MAGELFQIDSGNNREGFDAPLGPRCSLFHSHFRFCLEWISTGKSPGKDRVQEVLFQGHFGASFNKKEAKEGHSATSEQLNCKFEWQCGYEF